MSRRLFAPQLSDGSIELIETEAHHARDVLRLSVGDQVELFDEAGGTAPAIVRVLERRRVVVEAAAVTLRIARFKLTVCTAIPKGDRADWLIEKLSELGVWSVMPLITMRSVVESPRTNKLDRWRRIAIESAKQSRRIGVMRIEPAVALEKAIAAAAGWRLLLTTQGEFRPLMDVLSAHEAASVFVGPEGGWTNEELQAGLSAGLTPVGLTGTILRIETAAVAAASILMCASAAREGAAEV